MDSARDRELLLAASRGDRDAFALFYRRHVRRVLGFHRARTGRAELAADLTAETFAAVIERSGSYPADSPDADRWLFALARRTLERSRRSWQVEQRARDRLGMATLPIHEVDLDRIDRLADLASSGTPAVDALDRLPPDQREAVRARILDERDYPQIAGDLSCSEALVRQRVSRGLRRMREQLAPDAEQSSSAAAGNGEGAEG